jgi:hypothetical protein
MITGKLIRAGAGLMVNGDKITGVVIQTTGKAVMDVWHKGMYNQIVAVIIERRRDRKAIAVERRQ